MSVPLPVLCLKPCCLTNIFSQLFAPKNIDLAFSDASDGVYHRVISQTKLFAFFSIESILVTEETSQALMSESNTFASRNIKDISVTNEVFHFERSPLNERLYSKACLIVVTAETSQSGIGPSTKL